MRLIILSIAMAVLGLNACGHITMHDKMFCANGPTGQAACDTYYERHRIELTPAQWDALRPGWLCIGPEDYSNFKIEADDTCSKLHCTYLEKQQLADFFKRMEAIGMHPKL